MFDTITEFWRSLPFFLRMPAEFWISIILVRGILAKDITTWMEDRNFIKKKNQSIIYRALDFVYNMIQRILPQPGRKSAIWDHFKLGHTADVHGCHEGSCASL